MRVARRIYQSIPNVLFIVVGSDRVAYGGDLEHTKGKTFREHVLAQEDYDLSKFIFTGPVNPDQLARIFSLGDLHLYFTVPFVLSWSLFDALACGCTVVASGTPPVRELITHERNDLLADFYDVDGLADLSRRVLRDPNIPARPVTPLPNIRSPLTRPLGCATKTFSRRRRLPQRPRKLGVAQAS